MNDALLIGGLALALFIIGYWHGKDDSFDLRNLIVDEGGKVSLFKVGQCTALAVSTWAVIYETRAGHLTEWLFLAYAGTFGGLNVASKAIDKLRNSQT